VTASGTPSTRAIAKVFFTVLALSVVSYLVYQARDTVGLLFIALFLAVAMGPAVDALSRRRVPRSLAILLVYIGIAGSIFGVGLLVVPPIVTQVASLAKDIPGYLDDLRKNDQFRKYDEKYKITQKLEDQAKKLPSRLADAADALRAVTVGAFSAAVQLVTVLTITFFLLLDGGGLVDRAVRLLGEERARRVRPLLDDIYKAVAGYVAGNVIISLIAGLTTYVTLTALNVPFAVPLSVLMAFLDLIPLVGATIGGILIGLVTLFNDFPTSTIIWLVVFIVYQQIENNILQPVVYRRTVNVAPLLVIVSVLVGSSLLGVLGALLSIPVAATIQIVARDFWRFRAGGPDEHDLDKETAAAAATAPATAPG
jgi:predicted PurR-regulated permease PerM